MLSKTDVNAWPLTAKSSSIPVRYPQAGGEGALPAARKGPAGPQRSIQAWVRTGPSYTSTAT